MGLAGALLARRRRSRGRSVAVSIGRALARRLPRRLFLLDVSHVMLHLAAAHVRLSTKQLRPVVGLQMA